MASPAPVAGHPEQLKVLFSFPPLAASRMQRRELQEEKRSESDDADPLRRERQKRALNVFPVRGSQFRILMIPRITGILVLVVLLRASGAAAATPSWGWSIEADAARADLVGFRWFFQTAIWMAVPKPARGGVRCFASQFPSGR
jgi:hypothetical protein